MRLGGNNTFDLSDVERKDTLKSILQVARDVLEDYGIDGTRVSRMARWLVENLDNDVIVTPRPRDYSFTNNRLVPITQAYVGDHTLNDARVLASVILTECDYAEAE